jgi:hypothetical protein
LLIRANKRNLQRGCSSNQRAAALGVPGSTGGQTAHYEYVLVVLSQYGTKIAQNAPRLCCPPTKCGKLENARFCTHLNT